MMRTCVTRVQLMMWRSERFKVEPRRLIADLRWPWVLLLTLLASTSLAAEETINLAVGQQRTLNVAQMAKLAIGRDTVIEAKPLSPTQVLVTALAPGQSELEVIKSNGQSQKFTVVVTAIDAKQVSKEIKRLIGDREGISVNVQGDRIFLEGFALTLDDMQRVNQVAQMYPQVVKNQVKLDPSAKNMVAQQLNSSLQRAGLRGAVATVVNSTVFLEGKVDNEGDMKKAELVMKAMGENIQNLLTIGSTKMIALDVEFMEVSTNSLNTIGIRFPTDIAGTPQFRFDATKVFLPAGTPDQLSLGGSLVSTSQFGFGFLFTDGVTRSLAKPRLVCASGQKASFLAGGEIPVVFITQQIATIQFKEYGIKLNMTPQADARAIHLDVEAEVSDVDFSVAVQNVPGLLTRRVKTNIAVRSGETIALSGLLSNVSEKNVAKMPLLGHIPIIGELFKSRRFREKQSELVVFVTPRIVDADDEALQRAITDMTERLDRAKSEVKWGVFD